ncbi:MAG: hypothetical protein ACKOAR_14375, partial [Bacteroidota bacterium]
MAKNLKGDESKPDTTKKVREDEPQPLDVNAAAEALAQDELVKFKHEQKAAEVDELGRVIRSVTAGKKPALNSISLENFDWDAYDHKGFGEGYNTQERESLTKMYSG